MPSVHTFRANVVSYAPNNLTVKKNYYKIQKMANMLRSDLLTGLMNEKSDFELSRYLRARPHRISYNRSNIKGAEGLIHLSI